MSPTCIDRSRAVAALVCLFLFPGQPSSNAEPLTAYVDPLIGASGSGNTYPGAVVPFGMVQFSPDTRGPLAGYEYGNATIDGFSLTHLSGTGCTGFGDVFLVPTTGDVHPDDYASKYSHTYETAAPGYYSVTLDRYDVNAELSATEHAGIAHFHYPGKAPANILIPLSHTLTNAHTAKIRIVDDHTVEGEVTSGSFCFTKEVHTVYFVMKLSRPAIAFGTFTNGALSAGSRVAEQKDDATKIGAYLTFPAETPDVLVRTGISFVDIDGARRNLETEAGTVSLETIRQQASDTWERELHKIEITPSGGREDYVKFYTALYHCLLMPNVFSDVDGRYIGFDERIHTVRPGHAVYANFSGWDIYRSEFTLLCLLEPARAADMCNSIALMARQLGYIDRWPAANHATGIMVGDPLSAMVATAWMMGVRDFDVQAAYKAMAKPQPATDQFDKLGYLPMEVSTTQEYAYVFAAVSDLARALKKKDDAALFARRALAYRNLFDTRSGFFQPRDAAGNWPPFQPTQSDGFVEGSGWQYLWLAPHDIAGLVAMLGGDSAFTAKLDSFFAHPPHRWDGRYYNPENEVDLQAPFLYNWSGAPWKSQAQVRELLRSVYSTAPNGIPGNDDCGQMSSWYILSSLGLYPVDPANTPLELVSPAVRHAAITLAAPFRGKQVVIESTGEGDYVQSVKINGKPWTRNWVPIGDLTRGARIEFALGTKPNKTWGAARDARPPSFSDSHPMTDVPVVDTTGHVGDPVTITDADPKATIFYTLDGSMPTAASTIYTTPFVPADCAKLNVIAVSPGHTASAPVAAAITRPLPPGDGSGLLATYFRAPDLSGKTTSRIDGAIDFTSSAGKPVPEIGPENFSVRWEGEIKAPYSGEYTFTTTSDDGVRVWIDGKPVIDDWTDHSATSDTGHISLEAGRRYPIKVEYFNHGGDGVCRLTWSAGCVATQIVPAAYLYPAAH